MNTHIYTHTHKLLCVYGYLRLYLTYQIIFVRFVGCTVIEVYKINILINIEKKE